MSQKAYKADKIRLIMEWYTSDLSDFQWFEQNGIHPLQLFNNADEHLIQQISDNNTVTESFQI